MIDLVRKKHDGDGWIVFQELANSVGWSAKRWADAVALGVWASNKYEAHLYEFKESREDLKKELRDPTKAEGVGKFCHYWWLCVRDVKLLEGLAIPAVWGIVTPTKRGGSEILKVVRKAPKLKPQPFTPGFCVAAIRNIRKGFVDPAKHDAVLEELDQLKNGPKRDDEGHAERMTRERLEFEHTRLRGRVKQFEEASGVDFATFFYQAERVGKAVKFVLENRDLIEDGSIVRNAVKHLSETANEYERLAQEAARRAVEFRAMTALSHSERCNKRSQWSSFSCSCGVEPMSEAERKLAADGGHDQAAAPADADDDPSGGIDCGDARAPEQDAGLQLRDQRDAVSHGQ